MRMISSCGCPTGTAPGAGLFPYIVEESLVGFLEQSSKFLKPVYAGDTIYPALEVTELVPGRTTGVVALSSTVFNQRRELVLADRGARPHVPHLTLAHPRNPKSAGNSRDATAPLRAGLTIAFDVIQFIEQVDNAPWTVRGTIPHLAHSSGATERSLR